MKIILFTCGSFELFEVVPKIEVHYHEFVKMRNNIHNYGKEFHYEIIL